MDKINLDEYLRDILEKVEKVVQEEDDRAIEDLTSYIHMSKDIIRYRKTTECNPVADRAYCKIKEAEEKIMRFSGYSYRRPTSKLDIKEVFNTFVESLTIFSRA